MSSLPNRASTVGSSVFFLSVIQLWMDSESSERPMLHPPRQDALGHPASSADDLLGKPSPTPLASLVGMPTRGPVEELHHNALPDFYHWLQSQDLIALGRGRGWHRSSLGEGASHRRSSGRGGHHHPYPQLPRLWQHWQRWTFLDVERRLGSVFSQLPAPDSVSSAPSSLNCLLRTATTDLENLLPLSPLSNLGTAFSFHTSQGLPRHDMQPSSMPPGLGNAPVFYAHTAAGDPSNGTGSLISRDWQDAPSLATTLKLSRRGFPAVRSLGAGTSLGSRLGMGMLQACDEKVPSRRLEASGKNFSSLLTVKDSTSIVPHTEPRCDFDDSRLDVGPGNPWDVC